MHGLDKGVIRHSTSGGGGNSLITAHNSSNYQLMKKTFRTRLMQLLLEENESQTDGVIAQPVFDEAGLLSDISDSSDDSQSSDSASFEEVVSNLSSALDELR